MDKKEKIIIVGWGRMGVTHASILGGLYPNQLQFEVVEPNKRIAKILRRTLGYSCVSSLNDLDVNGAGVLITTPPSIHPNLVKQCVEEGARSVFVEKPFGMFDNRVGEDDRISVGYVLRFSEVAQTLKKIIAEEGCISLSLDYSSNTLTKKPSGWRNGPYGGVLNEMGSHLIDLILYLIDGKEVAVDSKHFESVISNVDDIVSFKGTCNDIPISLSLNWVNPDYRKPVWSGKLVTRNREVIFDQQSISVGFEPISVDYYVRGRDFSLQMKHFKESDTSIMCSAVEANYVHDLITTLKTN